MGAGIGNVLSDLFNDEGGNLRAKVIGTYVLLTVANIAAWLWAPHHLCA